MSQQTGAVSASEESSSPSADPAVSRIDDSVRALDGIADRPLSEHADLYQQVHGRLQAELADIDGS